MKLQIGEIVEEWGAGVIKAIRDNFKKLQDESDTAILNRGKWKFIELRFSSDVAHYKQVHGLSFQPLDVIQVSLIGSGSVTYNYELFDSKYLDLTVSSTNASFPLVVRFFVGRYS